MRDFLLIGSGIIISYLYWSVKRDIDNHKRDTQEYIEVVSNDLNETVHEIAASIEIAVDESDNLKRKIRNSKGVL